MPASPSGRMRYVLRNVSPHLGLAERMKLPSGRKKNPTNKSKRRRFP